MKDITKRYTNGEITILWRPSKCIHSGICFGGLPRVFDPRVRPWINMENSDSETMAAQVRNCPSGALSLGENETQKPDGL